MTSYNIHILNTKKKAGGCIQELAHTYFSQQFPHYAMHGHGGPHVGIALIWGLSYNFVSLKNGREGSHAMI
jgi:hypothetical protein